MRRFTRNLGELKSSKEFGSILLIHEIHQKIADILAL